jgi:hypothetical protein
MEWWQVAKMEDESTDEWSSREFAFFIKILDT